MRLLRLYRLFTTIADDDRRSPVTLLLVLELPYTYGITVSQTTVSSYALLSRQTSYFVDNAETVSLYSKCYCPILLMNS